MDENLGVLLFLDLEKPNKPENRRQIHFIIVT